MTYFRTTCVMLSASVFLVVPFAGHGANNPGSKQAIVAWQRWRGPSGQGYSTDTAVPLAWSEERNLLWKAELPGRGNSSPIIWGDRVFLTSASADAKDYFVLCVHATDGKLLWQKLAARETRPSKAHAWNGHASASCTTDGSRVYAFFGTPGLFCYDLDGNLLWKHHFGIFTSSKDWGTAASPFVFGDLIYQNCDNDGPAALPPGHGPEEAAPMALVALDKTTGNVRWTAKRDQGRGFSTPLIITTPQGRQDLVLNGPLGVWAYEPETGKELWHCERHGTGKPDSDSARFGEPVPAYNKDLIFATSGRPGPFQAIRQGGSGDVTRSNVDWEIIRKGHRDVSSPILYKGLLYVGDIKGMLSCYDSKSGQVIYNERLGTKALASPILVKGKLVYVLDDGSSVIVEPGRKFRIIGRNTLGDGSELQFVASPAVANGRLFIRSQSHLYCIGEDNNRSTR